MYFKPRIFISSTMGDKLKLRKEIKKIFEDVGAEVALYEKDLTPSIEPNTYRNDILQTDFVIFIIDERYGVPTNLGISGTEEELNIALYSKKPCHVYLKQVNKTAEAQRFEDFIRSKGISFYYYCDETDLKKKLKKTCFTVARDIVFSNIEKQQINPLQIRKMAINYDIEVGKPFCKLMESTIEIHNKTPFTFIDSNLMIQALSLPAESILVEPKSIFIDKKCNEILRSLCQQIKTFTAKMANESCPSTHHTAISFLNNSLYLSSNQWIAGIDINWYNLQLQQIIAEYNVYKDYLAQLSLEGSLIMF